MVLPNRCQGSLQPTYRSAVSVPGVAVVQRLVFPAYYSANRFPPCLWTSAAPSANYARTCP